MSFAFSSLLEGGGSPNLSPAGAVVKEILRWGASSELSRVSCIDRCLSGEVGHDFLAR